MSKREMQEALMDLIDAEYQNMKLLVEQAKAIRTNSNYIIQILDVINIINQNQMTFAESLGFELKAVKGIDKLN
jgi:hypothetical protein